MERQLMKMEGDEFPDDREWTWRKIMHHMLELHYGAKIDINDLVINLIHPANNRAAIFFDKGIVIDYHDDTYMMYRRTEGDYALILLQEETFSCVFCDKKMIGTRDEFKDDLSYKEFHISRLCQSCQDDTFREEE
jgi:hypothetical protein